MIHEVLDEGMPEEIHINEFEKANSYNNLVPVFNSNIPGD